MMMTSTHRILFCSLLLLSPLAGAQPFSPLIDPGTPDARPTGRELGCLRGDCENGDGILAKMTEQGRTVYDGKFRDGLYHGYGRLIWEDEGSGYTGYWVQGKREGRGTYWEKVTWNKWNVYMGQWRNDRRNGQGSQFFNVENWKENAHTEHWLKDHTENYTGNFQNDVFFGQGTYRWPDGTKYVGGWAANKKHGEGYFDYGNGIIARKKFEFDEQVFGF